MFLCPRLPLDSGINRLHSLSYGAALERAFLEAESSIFLSFFVLSFPLSGKFSRVRDLIDILGHSCVGRGLDVRVSMSFPSRKSSGFSAKIRSCYYLSAAGVPVRFSLSPLSLHSKICIIDEKQFFIGSHNFYDHSFKNPFETSVQCFDAVLSGLMAESFRNWWSGLISFPFVDGVSWLA